ncbi:MAG: RCC1 domain-containing protein, alpha-tubulin suppressor [Clostridia bacterium]
MLVVTLSSTDILKAASSSSIYGANWDIPKGYQGDYTDTSISNPGDVVQSMINTINSGGNVVIAGGTGGSVSSAMLHQVISGVSQNTGGSITIVAGIGRAETQSMMNTYLNGGTPAATNGTTQTGTSNFYYPEGFTGQTIYNYGEITSTGQPTVGNYQGGFLNYQFPPAPVYTPPPPPPPPLPSIVGSVSPTTGHPGQVLTLTAELGYATTSGLAKDSLGSSMLIPSSGSFTYPIPSNAKIGQYITLTFYSSNQWYTNISGNVVFISVENPMTMDTEANPSTLAPTEWSTLSASTTGYANKVSAIATPIQIDGTKNTIAAGAGYTLAIRSDNTVWASGKNDFGQLGNGTATQSKQPVKVQGLSSIVSISAGESHSIALKSDGTVWAWGRNLEGELGNGTANNSVVPVQVSGLTNIVSISAGGYHNLALKKDGTVWTWGYGGEGQIGNGTSSSSLIPVKVNNLPSITSIGAGLRHSLAIAYDGTSWAWGWNSNGQLGDNSVNNSTRPVQIIGITNAKSIAGGVYHSVLLKDDNSIWAWGGNMYGQLAVGDYTDRHIPVANGGSGYAIASSGWNIITIGTDNQVWTAGYGGDGQIGNGYSNNATTWTATGLMNVVRIGSGVEARNVLAITADNYAHIWGGNTNGEFADMTSTSSNKPVDYANTNNIADFSNGIALKSDGTLWQSNVDQWGGSSGASKITELDSVLSVSSSGGGEWYAVKSDGTLWHHTPAYYAGEDDDYYPPKTFVIPGINNAVEVYAEWSTPIVRKSDGTVWQIQSNYYGPPVNPPTQIAINNVVDIEGGYGIFYAIKSDGTVWHWGNGVYRWTGSSNKYYLPASTAPAQVPGVSNIVQVDGSYYDVAFLDKDGAVYSLGAKTFGNGAAYYEFMTPTKKTGLPKIVSMLNGGGSVIVIAENGRQYTWGVVGEGTGSGQVIKTDNPMTYLYSPGDASYGGQPGGPPLTDINKVKSGGYMMRDGTFLYSTAYYPNFGSEYIDGIKKYGYWPVHRTLYNLNFYGSSITYSIGSLSNYSPIKVNFTPEDGSFPESNSWNGSIQIPVNAPIYSQYIVTITSQSPWLYNSNSKPQTVSSNIILNVQNKILLTNPSVSKTNVNPGETISITVSSSGYALGVSASGPNPSNPASPIRYNMNPTSSITSIPKFNTWVGSYTIPSNAPEGAYPITLVGSNTTFVNQKNSPPVYLNLVVGSPPIRISDSSANINNTENTAYSHRATANLINLNDISDLYGYNNVDGKFSKATQQADGFWRVPRESNGYNNVEILMNKTYAVLAGQQVTESFFFRSDGISTNFQISFLTYQSGYTNPTHHPVMPIITDLGNGLKKATASYTVGQNESYIRAIDLVSLSGDWTYLDIANPQLNIPDQNIVTVKAKTSGSVDRVLISVAGQVKTNGVSSDYTIALPNMLSSDNSNWSLNYLVPDNVPDETTLTFTLTAVATNGVTFGPVYVAAQVNRHLQVSGHLSTQTASPGQEIVVDATTNGYATAVTLSDNFGTSPTDLTFFPAGSTVESSGNLLRGQYKIPSNAKLGQTIILTYTPKDTINGTTFIGQTDQEIITVTNIPTIKSVVWNQQTPYPGANTGAPTGNVDAIIITTGYVTSLNVSWDNSYNIAATNYVDLDSNGTRQWTIKNITVPITADVSNSSPTILKLKAQTSFIDQGTGSNQVIYGTSTLPISNKIKITAQQLADPVVTPGTPFTITVNSKGFAKQVFAKNINGALVSLTPSSPVSSTIPFNNTWTGTITIPVGTASQIYMLPVYGTNTTFINQPPSDYDYISLNVGGLANMFSAYLNPYIIELPTPVESERTVTMYAKTSGPASGVQVSLSVNGGTKTILPTGTMQKTSGTAPGVVDWQGKYIVDPKSEDGTLLTFSFQALDLSGNPSGQIITPPDVTVNKTKQPLVIITH